MMLLVSSMMNVAMWSHEEVCVDFQENNKDLSFCYRYPVLVVRNHSLECKSALIGMISPELCDSGICKFDEWLLYIGLAKLFDLALNLAALMIAGLDYGRYIYTSKLQLLRDDRNKKVYSTLRFIKLGSIIVGAVLCTVIPYLISQFDPVAKELVDMGCLRHASSTARGMGDGITFSIYAQMATPLAIVIQDLVYTYWKATRGQRYVRVPTSIEPAPSFNRGSGLPTSIEPAPTFMSLRVRIEFNQLFLYLLFVFWGLFASGLQWSDWGDSIQSARDLAESATTKDVGDWCFYCPGEKPIDQLESHAAVKSIGWFLVILNSMALLSTLVAAACSVRNNPSCRYPIFSMRPPIRRDV